jgi:hypothetical protein
MTFKYKLSVRLALLKDSCMPALLGRYSAATPLAVPPTHLALTHSQTAPLGAVVSTSACSRSTQVERARRSLSNALGEGIAP